MVDTHATRLIDVVPRKHFGAGVPHGDVARLQAHMDEAHASVFRHAPRRTVKRSSEAQRGR